MRTSLRWLSILAVLAMIGGFSFWIWPRTDWSKIDAIPPHNLKAFAEAHRAGLGFMERYDYPKARVAFQKAHDLAPGSIAESINLAIATLNDTGTTEAKKVAAGGEKEPSKFDSAIAMLTQVVERDPKNLPAHYCRGIILQYLGESIQAHSDFQVVTDNDPSDSAAWYNLGITATASS